MRRILAALVGVAAVEACLAEPPTSLWKREEVVDLRKDVWAEAAIRQPGGPSYEFFRDLFPPVRYVNTAFRQYPIVLSAPGAAVKARYVSNGSAINPKADQTPPPPPGGKPMWYDPPFGFEFYIGAKPERYGADLDRLDGPRYAEGWLPIVQTAYKQGGARVEQEAFAPFWGFDQSILHVRFTGHGAATPVAVRVRSDEPLERSGLFVITRTAGTRDSRIVLCDDGTWEWNSERRELTTRVDPGTARSLTVSIKPWGINDPPQSNAAVPLPVAVTRARQSCIDGWKKLMARGVNLEVPEPIVQNAWRACVVGNEMIAVGDRMHYSAGNAYDHLYEGECGDATRALMLFGQTADARRFIGPLLDFDRKETRFHVAGHKLQLLAHYYLVTRDAAYLEEKASMWAKIIDFITDSRKNNRHGLVPPDRYAGDIERSVYSLSSNAACWRGLRDMAVVLRDLGQTERADRLAAVTKEYRAAILDAVAKSERRETTPPFIPIALLTDEKPFDPLTSTRLGSYYDLMAPYVMGSDIFAGTEREAWLIDYLRHHGGLAMGMIRSHTHQGPFSGEPNNNVLYGLRYMLTILRRDDVPHALAGFYGQLAQAMTRDTFIGGEASRLFHGDARGRSFYLPPNSAANAMFLQTLRYLLVQDWTDDMGKPQELRLLYGAPGRWLADGTALTFERMPTLFGPVSVRCRSRLAQGEVVVEADAPPRPPAKWTVRLPLPPGWRVTSATVGDAAATLGPGGVVDLTGKAGTVRVRYAVEKSN